MTVKAEDDMVNGDGGYISDDSSFYGDDDLRSDLARRAQSYDPSSYWLTHHLRFSTIAFTALAKARKHSSPKIGKSTKLYNPYEGQLSCRQLSETVSGFLIRLVPSSTTIADIGDHWIRIANPYTSQRPTSEDWAGFSSDANEYLDAYKEARGKVEATMPGKAKATVTRKIAPLRKQLEADILTTAQTKGCTTGKWLLFMGLQDVDYVWSRIAKATAEDELGVAAKVMAKEEDEEQGDGKGRMVCVYTRDFGDKEDAKRVLVKMKGLGLLNASDGRERVIYYKCDALTHLGISSGNEYGIKASLFSSKDILAT